MNFTVREIYEIQNIGKGIINAITPNNLLKLKQLEVKPGFQDVLDEDPNLPFGNTVNIDQYFYLDAGANKVEINNPAIVSSILPAARIGKGIGNTATDVSIGFFPTQALVTDGQNNKGLEYAGDYEANFTDRSLITRQYLLANRTLINAGTNITVTGNGTSATPFIISATAPDGSETKISDGITTVKTGSGTTLSPYTIETVNLQKSITGNYTITSADNNYSIKVNNGASNITITVPTGLPFNFFAGITQKGSGDVNFVGSGTTISTATGFKIKGQGYHVGLEQIGASNAFDLLGFTKV